MQTLVTLVLTITIISCSSDSAYVPKQIDDDIEKSEIPRMAPTAIIRMEKLLFRRKKIPLMNL
jgi:hypothetical protein